MEQQPKKSGLKGATIIIFLSLGIIVFLFHCVDIYNSRSKVNYEIMQNDTMQAAVLIKEPLNKEIDSAALETIADSLFNNKPQSNIDYANWYRVRFFFKEDWTENPYYAAKMWSSNSKRGYSELMPGKLEITHETGDITQDSVYAEKHRLPPGTSSFDTVAYLKKIKGLSKKQINNLVRMQIDKNNGVKAFVRLCNQKLDSARISSD